MLVWSASSREQEFLQSQRNMVESSVNGVANHIAHKISDLRQSVKLFAQKETTLLKQVVEQFNNLDAYDRLVQITKKEFPNAIAITIADQLGEPYIEDFDGFILDICLRDIKTFSGMRHPPEVYIHPNPLAYHFDIMVKVDIGLGEQTIFFVSFSPDLISRILNNGELYSHKLMLVKNDSPGLVEVTSKGTRDTLSIDKLRLTDEETGQIIFSRKVPNTSWTLVDRPVNDYISKHRKEIWNETIAIIGLLFLFSVLMLYMQHRTEKKAKHKTDAAIQEKQAAQDASKAKSLFLANMSHEIRTPLTAIIGYGETLLRSDQSIEDRIEAVNTVISSGEHLLNLINDILDVSKIEAEKLVLENAEISPFKIASEVDRIISGQAKRKGVEFSITYDFPLPAVVYSDAIRVKQILLNLCSNAIKFTDNGYIRVSLRYEKSMDRLYFIIQDSGIGMSDETANVVFDSFTQADSTTTRKYGGTGLGLTLSKQLARLLGGDIDVNSKLGTGSTFALHIPTNIKSKDNLIYDEKDIPIYCADAETQLQFDKLSGKVLIAEDNINNQKLIKRHLEKMGLTVFAVDNGKRAIDQALSENYDMIFMDIQMPVMGGLEAVKQLREKGFEKPVVALTANALQEDKERCLSVGCNEYATKPIHYEQLYQITRKYMTVVPEPLINNPLHSTIPSEDEDYKKLIHAFVLELKPTIKKLQQACLNEKWDLLANMIHQLKGLGGSYGFPDITEISAKIEFQLVGKNYTEATALLNELHIVIERIILGYQQTDSNVRNVAGI
jgi:signal transduction histidine kinase/CheY-like chemotaxis protein